MTGRPVPHAARGRERASIGWEPVNRADMEKRPDEVAGMFNDVAPGYDRTNLMLSMGNSALWRMAVQRAIDPKPGERILDVAAGTGTSSAALARSGATVVAVDFSPGMIEEGRKRNPKIEFVEADAEKLPFGDDEFDAVTISFGLRNVADPKAALAEMYRVLKPGGRLLVCEFSHPPQALVRGSYELYLRRAMPMIAKVSSSNPDAYTYLARVDRRVARPGHAQPVDPRRRVHPRRPPQPHRGHRRAAPRPQAATRPRAIRRRRTRPAARPTPARRPIGRTPVTDPSPPSPAAARRSARRWGSARSSSPRARSAPSPPRSRRGSKRSRPACSPRCRSRTRSRMSPAATCWRPAASGCARRSPC